MISDGQVVGRPIMAVTLSVDHRAASGADGARLEGSKAFAKTVMEAAGVPKAEHTTRVAEVLDPDPCEAEFVTFAGDPRRQTTNVNAYRLYLKGRYAWNKRSRDGLAQAAEHRLEQVACHDFGVPGHDRRSPCS